MTHLDLSRFMLFLYIRSSRILFTSPRSLSTVSTSSPPKTSLSHSKPSTQVFFGICVHILLLVCLFFTHSSCISHFFYLTFGFVLKIWGFPKLLAFSQNFWVGFCENVFKSSCIASHLHYNNVSCILDVCLLCCNDCVLLGLDWAEPMMFLSLHVTCSCIFMHTYLQFVMFFYIVLLVLFWFFLSLPLSLSCISLHYGTQMQIHSIPKPASF